jgi:hypothetical protein
MDQPEPGLFANRTHPAVGGAQVEALPVPAAQDRTVLSVADGEELFLELDAMTVTRGGPRQARPPLTALPGTQLPQFGGATTRTAPARGRRYATIRPRDSGIPQLHIMGVRSVL